ncbi:MAG: glutamate synthase subunit alpha, partial [Ruminococcus sp.]|nr:glutamate synthase subunit alpha [Ruminococcus sp.]
LHPPKNAGFKAEDNIIAGNVALDGATSGKAFINGAAGERFCVRNSGAVAVCEGVGDHGCEYMTGGRVVVLGRTGKNFAAGMSGGIAYVLDENRDLYMKLNKSLVNSEEVTDKYDIKELRGLIEEHAAATGSEKAKRILESFEDYLPSFKKILPHDYAKMQKTMIELEEKGRSHEQAEIDAFYLIQEEEV